MILYRACLKMEMLSPAEMLIYSALVSKAITDRSELFSQEGNLYLGLIRTDIHFNGGYLDLPIINVSKLANKMEMSRTSVIKILKSLRQKELIVSNYIKVTQEIIDSGYFAIPEKTGLSGMQLILYSYLLDQSKRYGGTINTWASTIAEHTGISTHNVQCIISILHNKGLIERLPNSRLKIKIGEAKRTSPT